MKVVIEGIEYDYKSDYPEGWNYCAGDRFKFPVRIGDTPCFVKRFEKKQPAEISGWQLLLDLKAEEQQHFQADRKAPKKNNLPRLYDIVSTSENNHPVYYLFYEFLEGQTLDKPFRQGPIDLARLTDDLFRALTALHRHQHWFADFTEKNIFYDEPGKRFLLIDLDSTQPVSASPDRSMFGDKSFWGLVLRFYKEEAGLPQLKLADLPGPVLDCLQVIFLILFLKVNGQGLTQVQQARGVFFDKMVTYLGKIDAGFRHLFARAYQDSRHAPDLSWAAEIQAAIHQKIISKPAGDMPQILLFRATAPEAGTGSLFTLNWQVTQATKLELYRNGTYYKALAPGQDSIQVQEAFDGKPREVAYVLRALNQTNQAESKPVVISIREDATSIREEATSIQEETTSIQEEADGPAAPVIVFFTASTRQIKTDEPFTLSWQVTQAGSLKLYRNGGFYKEVPPGVGQLEIKEAYDGKPRTLVYSLRAANDLYVVESSPVSVELTDGDGDPEIISFASARQEVKNGEMIRLQWQVEKAAVLKIIRNGTLLQELSAAEKEVDILEAFNGQEKEVRYTLLALNETGQRESAPLVIRIMAGKETGGDDHNLDAKLRLLVLVAAIIGILAVAVKAFLPVKEQLVGFFENPPVARWLVAKPDFAEGRSVIITGNNFPGDPASLQVLFNSVRGKITEQTESALTVEVPQLGNKLGDGWVRVAVLVKEDTVRAWDTLFVRMISLPASVVAEGQAIEVIGNYFPPDAGQIQVLLNEVESEKIKYAGDTLAVRVPTMPARLPSDKVTVGVVIGGDTTYAPKQLLLNRIKLSRALVGEGEPLDITGNHFPVSRNSIQVFFDGRQGHITQQAANRLRVTVPRIGASLPVKEVAVAVVINGVTLRAPGKLKVTKQRTSPVLPLTPLTPPDKSLIGFINKNLLVSVDIPPGKQLRELRTFLVTVTNNSKYDIDAVFVDVIYNKNGIPDIKSYALTNVMAHSPGTKEIQVSDFGTAPELQNRAIVDLRIVNIHCRQRDADLKNTGGSP